jgi:hypothetical protein
MDFRKYIIVDMLELNKINFDEVLETSSETIRKNFNKDKFIIKWRGENPSFLDSLETKSQIYSNSEILEILSNEEWSGPSISFSGTTGL